MFEFTIHAANTKENSLDLISSLRWDKYVLFIQQDHMSAWMFDININIVWLVKCVVSL
jgi:hypothetical protein